MIVACNGHSIPSLLEKWFPLSASLLPPHETTPFKTAKSKSILSRSSVNLIPEIFISLFIYTLFNVDNLLQLTTSTKTFSYTNKYVS